MPSSRLLSVVLLLGQIPSPPPEAEKGPDLRLPNGRLQRDEMLKADHAKNLEDAKELVKLSTELSDDLQKNTQYVLSLGDIKKVEEIDKTARRIRARMKRY